MFLALLSNRYGHFITEEISRLWWILKHGTKGRKFVFAKFNDAKLHPYESYIFSLFGLDESNLIAVTKPTKFAHLIIPQRAVFWDGGFKFHPAQQSVLDFIASQVKPIFNEAIYLSRQKLGKTSFYEFGERYFEALYAQRGYKIIYPETIPLCEQIALYAGCKKMAALSGSAPHNALFMPYGSELEIILKTTTFNEWQVLVNELKGLKVKEISNFLELFGVPQHAGPFLFLPRDLPLNKQLLGDFKRDIKAYLIEYQRMLVKNYLIQTPTQAQLEASLAAFKNAVREIDERLFEGLSAEFRAFERWIWLYYHRKALACGIFRLKYLPRKIARNFKRTWEKMFL